MASRSSITPIRALLEGGVAEVIVVVRSRWTCEIEPRRQLDARSARPSGRESRSVSRMFSSIQEGVAQAQGDAILVIPGDMPFISAETVRAVIAAYERKPAIVSPRYRGKRGHPVALPRRSAMRSATRTRGRRFTT